MERDYNELLKQLKAEYPDHQFTLVDLPETNDMTQKVLVAVREGSDVPMAMTFVEGLTDQEIHQVMAKAIYEKDVWKPFIKAVQNITAEDIYSTAKIQLLNKEWNQRFLKSKPHFQVNEDLVGTYYFKFGQEDVTVTKEVVKLYDLDLNILKSRAMENMERRYTLSYMHYATKQCILTGGTDLPDQREQITKDIASDNIKDIILVSYNGEDFGAGNLLILDSILGSIKQDVYVLPMSIHMLGIIPSNINLSPVMLQQSIYSVNLQNPGDALSDNLYMYSPTKKQTRIYADKYGLVPECPDTVIQKEKRSPRRDH